MTPIDTAPYLAGYFDGEGCITVRDGLRLLITATHPAACQRMVDAYGGTVVRRTTKPGCKQQWVWTCYGMRAVRALDAMLPFLLEKQQQAILALRWYEIGPCEERASLAAEITRLKHISWSIENGVTSELNPSGSASLWNQPTAR